MPAAFSFLSSPFFSPLHSTTHVMKHIFFSLALSLSFALTAQAEDPIPAPVFKVCHLFDKNVELPAGTPVFLELNQKLECSEIQEGHSINFKVTQDVVVEGEILIRTGSIAKGEVTVLKASTYNGGAEVRIELKYVRAVDGQQVALNGNELVATGDDHGRGNGCTVRFSKDISANVTNDIVIDSK